MHQDIATHIVNAIKEVAQFESSFQIDEIRNNDENDNWLAIGDFHIAEGESTFRITVRTFPSYAQDNFYLQIRRQSRSLAEIHNTNEDETELLWTYRPAVTNGQEENELRKQRFSQVYGDTVVNISVPSGDITPINFLHDLFFVAIARIVAHDLQADIDGIENPVFKEGRRIYGMHTRKERSTQLVIEAKRRHRENNDGTMPCMVCDFDFAETYGSRGRGFIEAHHIVPLNELDDEKESCVSDLAMVCANCHRMLHRSPSIQIEELRNRLRNSDEEELS